MVFTVLQKKGRLQRLEEAHLANVGTGVMNKGTGLHIAIGIDMQVAASPGDAAVDIFPVVPEIYHENIFAAAVLPHPFVHQPALLRGGQELGICMSPDGDISEVPAEETALVYHGIDKLL